MYRRLFKGLVLVTTGVLATALVLVLLAYAALPWLANQLAQWVVPRYGLDQLHVELERPGATTWVLHRIEIQAPAYAVDIHAVRLSFDVASLLAGEFLGVDAERLDLTLRPVPESSDGSDAEGVAASDGALPDTAILAALPMRRLTIGELNFSAPAVPLRMQGDLDFGDRQLRFRMKASESPLDVPVRLVARLNSDGEFLARFHASEDREVHALEARGVRSGDTLDIAGDYDFGDYELALAASLFGIPQLAGTLTGDFRILLDSTLGLNALHAGTTMSLRPAGGGAKQLLGLQGSVEWLPEPSGSAARWRFVLDATQAPAATRLRADLLVAAEGFVAEGEFLLAERELRPLAVMAGWPEVQGRLGGTFKASSGVVLAPDLAPHPTPESGQVMTPAVGITGGNDGQQASPVPSSAALAPPLFPTMDLASLQVDADLEVAMVYDKLTHVDSPQVHITHRPDQPARWDISTRQLVVRQSDEVSTLTWQAPAMTIAVTNGETLTYAVDSSGDLAWDEADFKARLTSLSVHGAGQELADGHHLQVDVRYRDQSIPLQVSVSPDFDRWRCGGPLKWIVREPLLVNSFGMTSEYDITGGTFAGDVACELRGDVLTAQIQGLFKNGVATYDDLIFRNLTVPVMARLRKDSTWYAELPGLTLGSFDPGVPVTAIETGITLDDEQVTVAPTRGQLLGGAFAISGFGYDMAKGNAAFLVELKDIDLGAVLALEGEDLYGEGRLQGRLPVVLVEDAVTVTDGTLSNVGAGVIRLSAELAQSVNQPGLDFALRALQDFRFAMLEADIDYDAKGNLLAGIRLRGSNPAIEKGRAIHYNLNISENLPTLLASLRLQDEVNERVERRVQKGVK